MTPLHYLIKNKDITSLSNFKTPAVAEYYFEINNISDVDKIYDIVQFTKIGKIGKIDILFIWGWTNMLFLFEKFDWVVIKNNLEWWTYEMNTKTLKTSSNDFISDIAESLENDYGQKLWHRFIGLPWSVWWAVFGNAWCFWLEIENNFVEARVLNMSTWNVSIMSKKEMLFNYRTSILKQKYNKYFVLSAIFDLSTKVEKYHSDVDNIYFRKHKQPAWNTCGSFFKNPKVDIKKFWKQYPELYNKNIKAISAGFLLESSWLKWYQIWGAFFSEKHANFLMSDGTATHQNMKDIISYAQNTVEQKFGIKIENEVRIIKNINY